MFAEGARNAVGLVVGIRSVIQGKKTLEVLGERAVLTVLTRVQSDCMLENSGISKHGGREKSQALWLGTVR